MSYAYFSIVVFCVVQRISEVLISRRNCVVLQKRGFRRWETDLDFTIMIVLHTLWFVCLVLEPLLYPALVPFWLFATALVAFFLAQLLRFWTILSLKEYWNITVMGAAKIEEAGGFVSTGPYQYLRHPNYLAIVIEFLALPIMGGAWRTALIFSYVNLPILARRITNEERVLRRREGYILHMKNKGALLPGGFLGTN